jgi:CheY-like chemotaxis protein
MLSILNADAAEASKGAMPVELASPDHPATAALRSADLPSPVPPIAPRWPVLVVEDAHTCGRLAQAMLVKLGFQAVIVPNGYEAVAAIEQGTFEFVLMDLQMPLLDGLDATRLIRSRWPELRLSIYAMTGDEDAFTNCVIAGMDGILTKPVLMSSLAGLLGSGPR